jgi:S1-C subfamily serine protease
VKRPIARIARFRSLALAALAGAWLWAPPGRENVARAEVIDEVQSKMVKIYGAGGFRGLEAYQSGFLISEDGYIATVWSYVLDTDPIIVHLGDGRRFEGKVKGADPQLDLALVKIDGKELPHFDLDKGAEAEAGARVLAFSNLYNVATGDEPVSVQHGLISARTRLEARRGAFKTSYRGEVYVLDAVTNNPGAAGGALVNQKGELLGMLGKELKNSFNNTWLNYSVPVEVFRKKAQDIIAKKGDLITETPEVDEPKAAANPLTLELLGLVLVPNVLERTPPFVDDVRPNSPSALAGVMPDDLVIFISDTRVTNPRLIKSCRSLRDELSYIDRDDTITLSVMREEKGGEKKLLQFTLKAK